MKWLHRAKVIFIAVPILLFLIALDAFAAAWEEARTDWRDAWAMVLDEWRDGWINTNPWENP